MLFFMLGYVLYFIFFFFVFSILTQFAAGTSSKPLSYWCNNTETYNSNSSYGSNVESLLSDLTTYASRGYRFYNSTAGVGNATAYGQFMCRADVSATVCARCVKNGGVDIEQPCPVYKTVVIWYDECVLRYSGRSMFGKLDQTYPVVLYSQYDPRPDRFMRWVDMALSKTVNRITGKSFAFGEDKFNGNETIYTAGQCTPDLSASDCEECLTSAAQNLVAEAANSVLYQSCNVRYEVYPFYNVTAAFPPPLPPPALPPRVHPPLPGTRAPSGNKGNNSTKTITIVVVIIIGIIILIIAARCLLKIQNSKKGNDKLQHTDVISILSEEFSQYDYGTIQAITNNFSSQSIVGEGGYGFVYKGKLPDGQEVAIKRLSKSSEQGVQEFKNEVEVVAKLQHKNLVKLLGFCSDGEERILVYEFVPNKSLDYFLFDPQNQHLLDWSRRYKIIGGIARGLLYLHEDSRLRIIHRDLKASNILLDTNMNPKISDFGTAKIFMLDQTEENTCRIVGTYGYMPPEYALYGEFSVKSDIFSFGVLLLEIISGMKNRRFFLIKGTKHLLSYAWERWKDGTPLEILDPALTESYKVEELIQCIHIGLLCVQEYPEERPTMPEVMLMLSSYSICSWPKPSEPAFYRSGSDGMPIEYSAPLDNVTSLSEPSPN
ncbi:unnamed protein product [Cuscuta epithymum]|uniref:Uncharacterized protein n=1 Tax=Cuscuta epithymum TaxID=186058 RepID=A0AAV0D886_9ASTE|nr:unnamed protein product [Cuscuta epithymum]